MASGDLTPHVASGDLTRHRAAALLAGLAALSLATKLAFAWRFDGFATGDDLEVVETALARATGFEYAPWSLRNLFHPVVLVAPILRAAARLGPVSPHLATFLAAVPTALFSTAAIALVFAVARSFGSSETVALAAALLYAVHWLPWAYGGTPYPRPISTALFLAAILLATARRRPASCGALAGFLVATACAVRFSEGVLLVPLLAFAWIRSRDARRIGAIAAGFAAGAIVLLGVFDAWTWGRPFASFSEFVRIMHSGSPPPSATGDKPWYHYAKNVLRWTSPVHLSLIVLAVRDRRLRLPAGMIGAIVVLLSLFRYKQYRYLQAAIPFIAIAAALGWDRLRSRVPRIAAVALALAAFYGGVASVLLLRGKSQPAVAAARSLAQRNPPPRLVALEQAWAYGERLYLPRARIRDVPPSRPLDPSVVMEAVDGVDAAAFYSTDLDLSSRDALARVGLREDGTFHRDDGKPVTVFRRSAR
ncbi:MAG TPA: hypothetical protein VGA31_05815 [Thermoanaerobaculia bacterium]